MNLEGLDILRLPLIVFDKNLNVIFANKAAREINPKRGGDKCYRVLFGFDKPCWEIPGYRCPLKEMEEKHTTSGISINEYPFKGKFKTLLLETFKVEEGLFAELLLDFEEIELYEREKNPYHIDKSRLIRLVQEYLKRGVVFTISSINIKKLKAINQFFGIEVGDAVIKAIEKILDKFSAKYGFYFAEVAGGYFMVVNNAHQEVSYTMEKELFTEIDRLQDIFNLPVKPRVSIVSAEIAPILTDNADDIFKIMFYAEKFKTEDAILYLDIEKLNDILTTLGLKRKVISTLEDILKDRKVDIFFQPIVNLKTEEVEHIETLIRIEQNGNYIPIGKYIDLIYELNLVTEFDFQVLDRLNEYLPKLKEVGKPIFINVSSVDLKNQDYQERLVETIETFKRNGLKLSLEITEQVFLDEFEFLQFLHETMRLKFAIDDFGTGYSSLKMVIDLISQGVIEVLKLDCSLVRSYFENPQARALVTSVVGFTKMLGLATIAECVETKEQAETLRDIGVTHGQGWYFYKPMPVDRLLQTLKGGSG